MGKKKGSFLDVVKGLTQKKGIGIKDKEVEKYEKILQEHPDDRNALNALGDLYAKRNESTKALREYYLQVGELYAKDGFTLKAIAVYKKAQNRPDITKTYLDLADLYVQKGLIGEAKNQLSGRSRDASDRRAINMIHWILIENYGS